MLHHVYYETRSKIIKTSRICSNYSFAFENNQQHVDWYEFVFPSYTSKLSIDHYIVKSSHFLLWEEMLVTLMGSALYTKDGESAHFMEQCSPQTFLVGRRGFYWPWSLVASLNFIQMISTIILSYANHNYQPFYYDWKIK